MSVSVVNISKNAKGVMLRRTITHITNFRAMICFPTNDTDGVNRDIAPRMIRVRGERALLDSTNGVLAASTNVAEITDKMNKVVVFQEASLQIMRTTSALCWMINKYMQTNATIVTKHLCLLMTRQMVYFLKRNGAILANINEKTRPNKMVYNLALNFAIEDAIVQFFYTPRRTGDRRPSGYNRPLTKELVFMCARTGVVILMEHVLLAMTMLFEQFTRPENMIVLAAIMRLAKFPVSQCTGDNCVFKLPNDLKSMYFTVNNIQWARDPITNRIDLNYVEIPYTTNAVLQDMISPFVASQMTPTTLSQTLAAITQSLHTAEVYQYPLKTDRELNAMRGNLIKFERATVKTRLRIFKIVDKRTQYGIQRYVQVLWHVLEGAFNAKSLAFRMMDDLIYKGMKPRLVWTGLETGIREQRTKNNYYHTYHVSALKISKSTKVAFTSKNIYFVSDKDASNTMGMFYTDIINIYSTNGHDVDLDEHDNDFEDASTSFGHNQKNVTITRDLDDWARDIHKETWQKHYTLEGDSLWDAAST